MTKKLKFGLVVANVPNLVINDYKSHVVVNGVVTFWLISTSAHHGFHHNFIIKISLKSAHKDVLFIL